jgi:hypothetical protein
MKVVVKGTWLNACGKGSEDKEFEVIRVEPTMAREGSGFEVMYIVNDRGHEWTVAKLRCQAVSDWL